MAPFLQYRIWIGPRFLPDSDSMHVDYSDFDFDATTAITYNTTVATSLASGATSLVLTSGTSFGTKGGVWVGPNASGESWEYVGYTGKSTNTLTGLDRESTTYREGTGVHTAGAYVCSWYELADNNGTMELSRSLSQKMTSSYWSAKFSGFMAPSNALRNDHIAIVKYRTTVNGTWKILLVGVTADAHLTDDYNKMAQWEVTINSVHGLMATQESKGITVGDMEIGKYGKAYSSDVVGSAFKERWTEDYTASDPGFEAQNALKVGTDLMWIGDRSIGIDEEDLWHSYAWNQMFLNPNASRGPAYKWAEIINFSGHTNGERLVSYDPTTDTEYELYVDTYATSSHGGDYRIILTTDPTTFLKENPSFEGDTIQDVGGSDSILNGMLPAGGCVAIRDSGDNYSYGIRWGTQTDFPDGTGTNGVDWSSMSNELATVLDAPDINQNIWFNYVTEAWYVTNYSSPGVWVNDDGDDAWWAVILPGMGLYLRDDVTTGSTDDIYIVDSSGNPSTEGLDSSGTIYVGDDGISYTGKESDRLTGIGATWAVSADHNAGDGVQIFEGTFATDAHKLQTVKITFPGDNYPNSMWIYFSREISRMPNSSNHEEDYVSPYGTGIGVPEDTAAANPLTITVGGARYKTILIQFRTNVLAPTRPHLELVECITSSSYYDSDYLLDDGETIGEVIEQVFLNSGIPTGAITVEAGLPAVEGITTGADYAFAVLNDLADFAGLFVDIALDSKINIGGESLLSTAVGSHTPDHVLDRGEISKMEKLFTRGQAVSQVKLYWQNADNSDSGTALWPSTPDWQGSINEAGPSVYAASEAAGTAAKNRYLITKYPYNVICELAEGDLSINPGEIMDVTWQFNDDFGAINRLYFITGVDHFVQGGVFTTILSGIQIDREVDY